MLKLGKLRQAGRAVVEVGGVVPRTIMFVVGVCIRGYLVMVFEIFFWA